MAETNKDLITAALNIVKHGWHVLIRLDVAAVLIVIVLLVAALGSCFPQLSPSLSADTEQLARWETGVQTRYGPLTDALTAIKVFGWFRSPIFLAPLALLALV